MTEVEWLAADDPTRLVRFIEPGASDRKRRLYAVACCRSLQAHGFLTGQPYLDAVATAERFADGTATARALRDARNTIAAAHPGEFETTPAGYAAWTLHRTMATRNHVAGFWVSEGFRNVLTSVARGTGVWDEGIHHAMADASDGARRTMGSLVRCLFGNPFNPSPFDASWRTEAVVALARGVYDDHAFDRLPVLADALEDAGCTGAAILAHCRGDGPHARGCWVVDAVLGRE